MTTSTLDREIRARIEGFVSTLSELVKAAAVESVQQALGSGALPARTAGRLRATARPIAKSAATAKVGRSLKRGKRTSDDVAKTGELLLAYVKSHPGQGIEDIGRGMKVHTKELKLPVTKLLEAKKLKTKGKKRGTKYFAG